MLFALALLLWHPNQTKNNPMSQPIMDLHCFVVFCFFGVLYSELDAKAEEQCADSFEEIDRFSRGFSNLCPTFLKPNGTTKQTNGGP